MLRKHLSRTGFRRQLTVTVTSAILCLALVSSLVSGFDASRHVRRYLLDAGQLVADNLARQSALALLYHAPENARDAVATTLAFPDVLQVGIYDPAGQQLLSQAKPGTVPPTQGLHADLSQLDHATLAEETDAVWVFEAPVRSGAEEDSPFEVQSRTPRLIGHVRVVLAKTTLDKLVTSLLSGNLAITTSIAIVLLVLLNVLTRHLMQPLNALSGLMRRAEKGESGMRAEPGGPSDIVEMGHAFNKMMDVLEQREAELTASRDEALRAALLKSQFAATVSHELRTPLNGVVGMLDMLKAMPMPPQQKECVEEAFGSARSLAELINDILDFSKMEAGKLELEAIDFNLRDLVEEAVELLAQSARQKDLALGYWMDPEVPERVKGDPTRLRQVLLNLLGNAIKFTERGEVALRIWPRPAPSGQISLRFEVSDTGIGMSQQTLEHVFESFSQADRSTTRRYGGTGLGLAISKQLVGLMGGDIEVRSELGRGSSFAFVVSQRPADTPAAPLAPVLHGERVLVVDESEIVRRFAQDTLNRLGARCHALADGELALQELRSAREAGAPYALALLGPGAHDGAGRDLYLLLEAETTLGELRLLKLTRDAGGPLHDTPGAELRLQKPLTCQRLVQAVLHLLAPHIASRPGWIEPPAPADAPTVQPLALQAVKVLVAEDNRTNKAVAAGMLRLLGCQCRLVSNGLEAVQAMREEPFDLVLMDCSMPEMDGYEATASIRLAEEGTRRHTPIIAMTANTQRGSVEKCLAAGMDDYLSKPITLAELGQKMQRWLTPAVDAAALPERDDPDSAEGPLDRAVFDNLRAVLGPSIDEAVTPFLEDIPTYLDLLQVALDEGDADKARAMAHSMKGSSANLGAVALSRLARQAQELAEAGRLSEIGPLMPQMREAFDMVSAVLGTETRAGASAQSQGSEQEPLVLVVDDDRSTCNALRFTLQRDGFRVEEAADGAQALALLERIAPDVILMDAVMPVMDGFAACEQIKQRQQTRGIPVLMITALEDTSSVERAFAAGASDYIPKPIHFAVLSQRVRSIIDANRAERHIRRLAYNDSLTGLPNRTLFIDQLSRRLERAGQDGESIAVLFLDLDRFKYVNDSLGHDVGDRLLAAVAQRIRRVVRQADCVARLGGDEFTVALNAASGPAAAAAAQNICRTLGHPFQVDGHEIFVAASVGIALFPQDGPDVGTLLKHADMAMYRAKKDGSGFRFFEAAMEHTMSAHLRLETDLRRALDRKELVLYYQPKARVDTGDIVGVEALVRWRHPTRGLVPPADFIPLAEETGLIIPMGEWVLRSACSQAQAWIDAGRPPLQVAVNISVRQLLNKDFVELVERVLRDTRLSPGLLELEITESTLMGYAQDTLELLRRLRKLGVRLSIDDFGTGYSSLAYLKRFPINTVKIDRAFVGDVPHDPDDVAIVTGIIALAHSLRLEVIAEGVETHDQLVFLRERSCDQIQGFLLSEPVPAAVFEQTVLKMPRIRAEAAS